MKSNYDVVILGSGIAGLSAALAAHEAGLKPLLLEKSDLLGGGTTNSYGLIWVGENHIQLQAGLKDSRERHRQLHAVSWRRRAQRRAADRHSSTSRRRCSSASPIGEFPSVSCAASPITISAWRPGRSPRAGRSKPN